MSGVVRLENVRLRPDAFNHLKLPFAVREGTIALLELKVRERGEDEAGTDTRGTIAHSARRHPAPILSFPITVPTTNFNFVNIFSLACLEGKRWKKNNNERLVVQGKEERRIVRVRVLYVCGKAALASEAPSASECM